MPPPMRERALAWMRAWAERPDAPPPEDFDAFARSLHAEQRAAIPAFGAYCAARSESSLPADAPSEALPCVPVAAFKRAPLQVPAAVDVPVAIFETSGTSDGQPGVVRLADTALYDRSLRAAFHHFVVPDAPLRLALSPGAGPFTVLSLVPDGALRRRSSLAHMVGVIAETWGAGPLVRGLREGGADGVIDVDALAGAAAAGRPVLILATSIALALLREAWPAGRRIALPQGSRLMDTGGPKGRRITVSRDDQHRWLADTLGLEPALIVGELGMTELGSQRYETTARAHLIGDVPAARAYVAPPWLRSVVLSAGELRPLPLGETGLVAHIDLANHDTCAFVLTADRGRLVRVGETVGLVLDGRVPGAEWRGCGLDVEGMLG